jgi:hypothetical protein
MQLGVEPPLWSPQEVTVFMSGIADMLAALLRWRHVQGSQGIENVNQEKLNASLTDLFSSLSKWCGQPGRLSNLKPGHLCEFILKLGSLAENSPIARCLLHGVHSSICEAAVAALSKADMQLLHKQAHEDVVVGLAKLNANLESIPGLHTRIAVELEAASQDTHRLLGNRCALDDGKNGGKTQEPQRVCSRAANLFWAVALHAASFGREPPLQKRGLDQAATNFASRLSTEILEAVSSPDTSVEAAGRLEEDAFSRAKAQKVLLTQAPDKEDDTLSVGTCSIRSGELSSALWTLVTLSCTDGGTALRHLSPLREVLVSLGQCSHAGGRTMLAGCSAPDLSDCLVALARAGISAGAKLRSHIAHTCEDSANFWVSEMLQGQLFPGYLLYGALLLTAENPAPALLDAARRVVVRIMELAKSRPNMNAFVSLMWALTVLDLVRPEMLADALWYASAPDDGKLDDSTAFSSPTATWECSLFYELLLFAAPRPWPASLMSSLQRAWNQERSMSLQRLGDDVPATVARLPSLLARLSGKSASLSAEVRGDDRSDNFFDGLIVDAAVPDQRVAIELVLSSTTLSGSSVGGLAGRALSRGGSRALKWSILVQRGWSIVCLPATALLGNAEELSRIAQDIDAIPRQPRDAVISKAFIMQLGTPLSSPSKRPGSAAGNDEGSDSPKESQTDRGEFLSNKHEVSAAKRARIGVATPTSGRMAIPDAPSSAPEDDSTKLIGHDPQDENELKQIEDKAQAQLRELIMQETFKRQTSMATTPRDPAVITPGESAAATPLPKIPLLAQATPGKPVITTDIQAVVAQPSGDFKQSRSNDLVLVELSHGTKRKRLQLPPSMLIGRLIEDYGKVVKGDGTVIVVNQDGVEISVDVELGALAAEANSSGCDSLLHLQLKLDEWLL